MANRGSESNCPRDSRQEGKQFGWKKGKTKKRKKGKKKKKNKREETEGMRVWSAKRGG